MHFRDIKYSLTAVILLDFITFYLNSMMASPYYSGDTLVGVGKAINYFSFYNNPLGIVMTSKAHWFTYLAVRFVSAVVLMILINLPLLGKDHPDRFDARTLSDQSAAAGKGEEKSA